MARLCVRGVKMMYDYLARHKLPHERIGKLIVACNEAEAPVLKTLLERGTKNGVEGLRILTGEEVKKMEPNVVVHSALYSPNTGIAGRP
jgi:L-2-hydroxyglutarate oxidase LhgO